MNGNLPGHDMPERDEADFLTGALHGAADAMPGGEAEEVHLQFGVVRDRVHRRRATKIGGIGVATLAVVGGLAVGATQLTMFDDEAQLPADPSPSDSRSASPSASAPESRTGWMPSDIYEDTGLFCGAGAGSIPRSAEGSAIEFEGSPYRVGDGDAATAYVGLGLQELSKSGGGTLDLEPAAVWIQDGEIVNLSRSFDPEPPGVTYNGSGLARTDIRLDPVNACDPPDGAGDLPSSEPVEYEHVLPAGEYQVVPVLWTDITVGAADYVTGESMVVEVLPDESVATEGAASGSGETGEPSGEASGESGDEPPGGPGNAEPGDGPGDCSAAGLEDKSDFSFEPEPVAQTAQALVDAARACDLAGLQEVEEPGVTQLHRAAEVPVAERFALPEGDDDVYAKLATLLSGVAVVDPDTGNYVWPTVASSEYREDPVAWDYAVEMGFATQAQADAWRAAGGEYYGWRMSIEPDGTWRTFLGPDPAAG